MATCPDARFRNGKKAVELATRACELTEWKLADMIDSLAAAHAEAGDFDAAVKWQIKANVLYDADANREEGRARLELYLESTPYRQPDR